MAWVRITGVRFVPMLQKRKLLNTEIKLLENTVLPNPNKEQEVYS